jgi:hypothetical protein
VLNGYWVEATLQFSSNSSTFAYAPLQQARVLPQKTKIVRLFLLEVNLPDQFWRNQFFVLRILSIYIFCGLIVYAEATLKST